MNKKRLLILSAIVLVAAVISLVLFLIFSAQKSEVPKQDNPPVDTPFFPKNDPFSKKDGISTSPELRNNTLYFYSSSDNPEDLKKKIIESLNQKIYPESINWISYATTDKKQILLSDFSVASGIKIDSRLDKLLDQYNYDRIVCKKDSGELDYGFVINNKLFDNYPTLEQEEKNILRSWEPTMLKSLYKILFPDTTFTEQDLNQTLIFKNGKYRFAEITLPDDKKKSLNYHLLVDSIVFTNSLECMDYASQAIEEID